MTDPNDWNAKIIAQFRANEAASGRPSRARPSRWSITAAARAVATM